MRTHLNKFINDDSKNIYNFEVKELKRDSIVLILDEAFGFSIEIIGDHTFKLRSEDEYLQEWVESVESSTLEKFTHIGEYLDEITRVYTEMPEDDTSTLGTLTPLSVTPSPFAMTSSAGSNEIEKAFDDAILPPNAQIAVSKQSEMIKQNLVDQMEKTKGSQQFSDVFKKCSEHEIKGSMKKLVKQLYLLVYQDGYTVGSTMDPKNHGPLRDVKDSVMKSLQAGYVPPMYAGSDKEVDVHFIHKEFKFKERVKEMLKKEKEEKERKKKMEEKIMKEEIEKLKELEEKEQQEQQKEEEEEQKEPEKEVKKKKVYLVRKKISLDVSKSSYKLDERKKVTSIKFSFHDNSKLIQKFCVDDKLEIVKKFVLDVTSEKDCDFFLANRKVSSSADKTLHELNILNSTITVKILQ